MRLEIKDLKDMQTLFQHSGFKFNGFKLGNIGVVFKSEEQEITFSFGFEKNDEKRLSNSWFETKNIEPEKAEKLCEVFKSFIKRFEKEEEKEEKNDL